MAKSIILNNLVQNKITVLEAIDRLYLIAFELDDKNVCEWIKKEKEGYKNFDTPDYRFASVSPIGTYQIISAGIVETYSNKPLPTSGIPEEQLKSFNHWPVNESLASLVKQKEASENCSSCGIPLDPVFFGWFQKNTNILMRSAMLHISDLNLETILDAIKFKIIQLLLLYERNFGCLDDFDITNIVRRKSDIKDLMAATESIVADTKMGKTKITIKNSNIGYGNKIDKKNEVDIKATINNEKQQKRCLLKRIFSRKK